MSRSAAAALVLVASSFTAPDLEAQTQRPYEIDDIFRIEQVRESYAFSADGQLVAFVVARAIDTDFSHHFYFANDRSDVWIYDRSTGSTRNLTRGVTDSTSFWYPVWSPAGDKLAMVSTRGVEGEYHRVWVWERSSGKLAPVSDRFIDINNDPGTHGTPDKIIWSSDSELIFRTLPPGVPPTEPRSARQTIYAVSDLWRKALEGRETSAVVFESGRPIAAEEMRSGESFVSCDVEERRCTDILDSHVGEFIHDFWARTVVPAPSGSTIAAMSIAGSIPADPDRELSTFTTNLYRVDLFDGRGVLSIAGLDSMNHVVPGSGRWSPDGSRFALVGSFDDTTAEPRGVFIASLPEKTLHRFSSHELELIPRTLRGFQLQYRLFWNRENQLVVHARMSNDAEAGSGEEGWWLLRDRRAPARIAPELDFVPAELVLALDGASYLGRGMGDLWLISPGERPTKLTDHGEESRLETLWSDGDDQRGIPVTQLVYRVVEGEREAVHHLDLRSQASRKLHPPSEDAEFAAYSPAAGSAVFAANTRDGTAIWVAGPGNEGAKKVFETNTFLRDIAEAEVRRFHYRSIEGDSIPGWLILPIDYRAGRRYPAVTWVYQGSDQTEPHSLATIATLNPLNLQTLAAKGYAVIIPSMPGGAKAYRKLLDGVLPAVDKAAAMGIVDPDRVAVMGQSNGGFSTYGIVTRTNRFKAAIAFAGMTDHLSIALQFEPPFIQRQMWEAGMTSGRLPMLESWIGWGLPWESTHYLENSPIMYVDQVETPILQLHGDLDGVPIAQAEEFFTALQRLGKRAKFVRYIGDDHVFHSPANIRHSWEQVFHWLDQFMGKP